MNKKTILLIVILLLCAGVLAERVFKLYLRGAGLLGLGPQIRLGAFKEIILVVIRLGELTQFIQETHGFASGNAIWLFIYLW